MADLSAAGMRKRITFHVGSPQHGRCWGEWEGAGTQWWDGHGNPNVGVGVCNVLCDQLGLSEPVQTIGADGAVSHVFDNRRHRRGVAVAWALDGERELIIALDGVVQMDAMGNQTPLAAAGGKTRLALAPNRKPHYLFRAKGIPGTALTQALEPLRRRAFS